MSQPTLSTTDPGMPALESAIAAEREVLRRNPEDPEALNRMGPLLAQARKFGQATEIYLRLLKLDPGHGAARAGAARLARTLEKIAAAHAAKGEHEKVVDASRKAIELDPDCPIETHLRLGVALDRLGRTEPAIAVWRRASERHPGSAAPLAQMGAALRKLRRMDEAVAAYQRAIAASPEAVGLYRSLADLYVQEGSRLDLALELCRKIRQLRPADPDSIANEANVIELMGKPLEAYEMLLPVVRAGQRTLHLALAFGRVCQRIAPPSGEALPLLRDELVRRGLSDDARTQVLRALAGLCDALGQADEAFLWLEQGKHLDADRFEDSKEELLGVIERSIACFTRERLARLPRAGHGSGAPIFIVGMPRTGTSLAEQILASHPKVFGAGELTTIIGLARTALGARKGYPQCFEDWTQARVDGSAALYLDQLRQLAPDAARVTDKMPFNFLHLGMIEVLFPNAKIVHCTRNALDTCVSCYFMEFTPKLSIFNDLTTLGRYYRGYRRLMRHWKGVLGVPVFELGYERLLAEPERTVRELVAFCGLEWDDACMKFHESKRRVKTFSYHQVRKPLYTQSVGRARAYQRFLGPLIEAIGDELEPGEIAGLTAG